MKEKKLFLLNRTFFKNAKDYVFSLTVVAHNILYYDAIVNKTHYFHLRTNSYPVNGNLNIIPTSGLYRSTYFIIKCQDWEDDTSPKEKLQYRFFSKEIGTNNLILLRDWSLENEISTNFSVMYYQQDKSDINITCEIKDELNATTSKSELITIAKSLTGIYYSLPNAIAAYPVIPEEVKSYEKYDVLLYHRSLFLLSLASDTYKTAYPSFLQTIYEPTLQGDMILMEDPTGVSDYCNGNGEWVLVDEFIICRCNEGWIGKYCQIDTNGNADLEQRYNDLYEEIMGALYTSISWYEFMTVYNIFKGASLFIETENFISANIKTFLDQFAMVNFGASIANNTQEYFDILDFYYSYELMRMEKIKVEIQRQNNLGRQVNLTNAQMVEFKQIFEDLNDEILKFMRYLANQNTVTRKSFTYDSENFYLAVIPVNPSFDDEAFFRSRKSSYKTYIEFMSCLNYIEIEKLSNQYYQGYLIYIEYYYFPFSYNSTLIENNVSPLIELQIVDSTTAKPIKISGCNDQNKIRIHMPFHSYRYLTEFNSQKSLYDPDVYKSPDDPIFSDPVYIEENGKVSDDTIEQRIEKYSRRYNISPNYFY